MGRKRAKINAMMDCEDASSETQLSSCTGFKQDLGDFDVIPEVALV